MAKPDPRRMLVLLSWLNSAGPTPLPDLAARFSCTEDEVLADLDKAMMTGLPPFTDDCLVSYEHDRGSGTVRVSVPPELGLPMRLTEYEAFSLIAAARAFAAVGEGGPVLEAAVEKVEGRLGVVRRVVVHGDRPVHLGAVTDARVGRRRLRFGYRDADGDLTSREAEPVEVLAADGRWYMVAVDVGDRTVKRFRVDRVDRVEDVGPGTLDLPADGVPLASFVPADDAVDVRLRFPPTGRWVVERYPVLEVVDGDDGTFEATFRVADPGWLARMAARARATVLSPADWVDVPERFAEGVRGLYTG